MKCAYLEKRSTTVRMTDFAADLGQPLDEVHRDIRPHLGRYFEGLQQADGL